MRFLVMVMANSEQDLEADYRTPKEEELAAMTKFNEELAAAGVMLAGEGLTPSSKGVKVTFTDGEPIVTDGPFAEAKELIAGYWVWKTDTLEDAVAWLKRAPFGPGANIHIRKIAEFEDFGELSLELRDREKALGETIRKNAENA